MVKTLINSHAKNDSMTRPRPSLNVYGLRYVCCHMITMMTTRRSRAVPTLVPEVFSRSGLTARSHLRHPRHRENLWDKGMLFPTGMRSVFLRDDCFIIFCED